MKNKRFKPIVNDIGRYKIVDQYDVDNAQLIIPKEYRVKHCKYHIEPGTISSINQRRPVGAVVLSLTDRAHIYRSALKLANNASVKSYRAKLDTNNGIAESIIEARQSMNTATSIAREINSAVKKAWKKYRYFKKHPTKLPGQLVDLIGSRTLIGTHEARRIIPEWYLTYQFGIKPLVGSLHDSLMNATRPFNRRKIVGVGHATFADSFHDSDSWDYDISGDVFYRNQCFITGIHHNEHAYERLGIYNASVFAWDIVPWSWLVDYFVNVGDVMANLNGDPVSLELSEKQHTQYIRIKGHLSGVKAKKKRIGYDDTITSRVHIMQRSLGNSMSVLYFTKMAYSLFDRSDASHLANALSAVANTLQGKADSTNYRAQRMLR